MLKFSPRSSVFGSASRTVTFATLLAIAVHIAVLPLLLHATVIDEQTARAFFSEALVELYNGNYKSAYELSKKAMSGRIFMQELPYFWYLRGRLAMMNGEIDKALEDLLNFTFLVRSDDIENLINRLNYFRRINLLPSKEFDIAYVTSLSGRVGGIDYFQSPVSLAVFGNEMHVLDIKNKRLVTCTGNRISRVRRLSREYKQVFVSRSGKVYLVTDTALYDVTEKQLLGDLRVAVVAGVSRTNDVFVVDLDRVVIFNVGSKKSKFAELDRRIVCIDAEMDDRSLFVLDGVAQEVLLYDIDNLISASEKTTRVKVRPASSTRPPANIWSFEVTPFGDFIYLLNNKVSRVSTHRVNDKVETLSTEFELKNVNLIEFSYPMLFAVKWLGSTIDVYQIRDDKPLFVSIDRMLFDDTYAYAYVRAENLLGDDLHFVQNILTIAEQDVYTPSEILVELVEVPTVPLKTCESELAYYRFRGERVSGGCGILNRLTGSAQNLKNTTRVYWVAKWRYLRPVPDGLIKLAARITFKSQVFYDVMFYTNALLKSLRKEGS